MLDPITVVTTVTSHKIAISVSALTLAALWDARRRFGVIDVMVRDDEVVFVAWDVQGFCLVKFSIADIFSAPPELIAASLQHYADLQRPDRRPTPHKRALSAAHRSKRKLAQYLTQAPAKTQLLPSGQGPIALLT